MQFFTVGRQACGGLCAAAHRLFSCAAASYRRIIEPTSFDEDKKRKELVLNTVLVLSIALLSIFCLISIYNKYIIFKDQYVGISWLTFCFFILISFMLLKVSKNGFSNVSSYILITAFICGTLYSGWTWGASLPATLLLMALSVVTSSILINSKFGFILAFAMIFCLTGFGIRESVTLDFQHWRMQKITVTDVIAYSTIIFFIYFISWLSNNEIKNSLDRAKKSEKALETERNLLEKKISDRTRELVKTKDEHLVRLGNIAEFGAISKGIFHDLINPLSSVSMCIEEFCLENRQTQKTKKMKESFEHAIFAVNRLRSYMASVRRGIDSSTINEITTTDLDAEINICLDLLAYKIRMNNIEISVSNPEHLRLCVHPVKIHQILLNLIGNSIDACSQNPEFSKKSISISVYQSITNLTIEITDSGPGIPKVFHEKIGSEPFSTKIDGTGIGLMTVRKITEDELGGSLTYESKSGIGACFVIKIPMKSMSHVTEYKHIENIEKTQPV